jgi:LETM1 and EF-hand domain-containing protein 1
VPFSVFIVVPFMELLLPVAIKLFPNMLPSTFEDKFAAEEKQRKALRVRLEMAKFLQETIRETGLKGNAKIVASEEFKEFFRKVRSTGETPSSEDILKVAKLFSDDITLDNLSRPQLTSICRYLGLNAFGTDNFLKGTIRRRLEYIKRDDEVRLDDVRITMSTDGFVAHCDRGSRYPINLRANPDVTITSIKNDRCLSSPSSGADEHLDSIALQGRRFRSITDA